MFKCHYVLVKTKESCEVLDCFLDFWNAMKTWVFIPLRSKSCFLMKEREGAEITENTALIRLKQRSEKTLCQRLHLAEVGRRWVSLPSQSFACFVQVEVDFFVN